MKKKPLKIFLSSIYIAKKKIFILYLYLFLLLLLICLYSFACGDNSTSSSNTTPTASFIVTPDSGYILTNFNFDASGSSDNEDPLTSLQVRWDWENDGTWDTEYSTTKSITHQFSTLGTKTVKLEIKDSGGLTDATTGQMIVTTKETGTVIDIDGNVYQTVKIGNQWWMAENLKVTKYRNGDSIPNVSRDNWFELSTGAYCDYEDNSNFTLTYGHLYNWYAASDSRNIAPVGWHVPTDTEWNTLVDYLGGGSVASGKMREKGLSHWESPNYGATNESGFLALPGGIRTKLCGWEETDEDCNFGQAAYFLSTTECENYGVWYCGLFTNIVQVSIGCFGKQDGMSVRCVKD